MLEFLECERTIIESGRHAETVIDESLLARAVSVIHAANLRNGLMRFVNDEQKIGGEIIEQSRRSFAGKTAGKMAGIIFDAVAIADGAHHFDVETSALFDALGFDDFALAREFRVPPFEFFEDGLDGALALRGGKDVMRFGINRQARNFFRLCDDFSRERIDAANGFDFAAPHFDAHGEVVIGRVNFNFVAAHAEGAAAEILAAFVENFDELAKNGVARKSLALFEHQHHAVIRFGGTEAVNAGDGGDDDDVATLEKRTRGAHAKFVELFVDGGFLLDINVRGGHVGFGLVVIVVADEILDGVAREKRTEFVIELRGESFVVGDDERGAIQLLDHLGHGERLARAGDAEEHLMLVASRDTALDLRDGFGLVAARFVVARKLEIHAGSLWAEFWCRVKLPL